MCVCCVFIAFPSLRTPFWAIFCLTVDATACHVLKRALVRDMPSHRPLSRKSPKTPPIIFDRISAPYKFSYYTLWLPVLSHCLVPRRPSLLFGGVRRVVGYVHPSHDAPRSLFAHTVTAPGNEAGTPTSLKIPTSITRLQHGTSHCLWYLGNKTKPGVSNR